MTELKRILIIDDCAMWRSELQKALTGDFVLQHGKISEFEWGYYAQFDFDIVLFAAQDCRIFLPHVAKNKHNKNGRKPLLFLCGFASGQHIALEELGLSGRLETTEDIAQLNDYLAMMCAQKEMLFAAPSASSGDQLMAEIAMKQASVYGYGLSIIASLNNCKSVEEMASLITQGMKTLELHCALQFRHEEFLFTLNGNSEACHPIEMNILRDFEHSGRVLYFADSCLFSDQHVSILINVMPPQGSAMHDALLDMLAKLVPAVDTRLLSMREQLQQRETYRTLMSTLRLIEQAVEDMFNNEFTLRNSVLEKAKLNLENLKIKEEQKQLFIDLFEKYLEAKNGEQKFVDLQKLIKQCLDDLTDEYNSPSDIIKEHFEQHDVELF